MSESNSMFEHSSSLFLFLRDFNDCFSNYRSSSFLFCKVSSNLRTQHHCRDRTSVELTLYRVLLGPPSLFRRHLLQSFPRHPSGHCSARSSLHTPLRPWGLPLQCHSLIHSLSNCCLPASISALIISFFLKVLASCFPVVAGFNDDHPYTAQVSNFRSKYNVLIAEGHFWLIRDISYCTSTVLMQGMILGYVAHKPMLRCVI